MGRSAVAVALAAWSGCVDPGVVGEQRPSEPSEPARDASACPSGRRLDLYLLIDDSTSMIPWWTETLDGISAFMSAPESVGVGVGLQLFGTACEVESYVQPRVPIAPLPGNAGALQNGFPLLPVEESAMRPALEGATRYARDWALQNPNSEVLVVLMTDGVPEECDSTLDNVSEIAKAAQAGQPSIRTHVIVVGVLATLEAFVQAGGTNGASFVNPGSPEALPQVLSQLRDANRPCTPEP